MGGASLLVGLLFSLIQVIDRERTKTANEISSCGFGVKVVCSFAAVTVNNTYVPSDSAAAAGSGSVICRWP